MAARKFQELALILNKRRFGGFSSDAFLMPEN
jgi:hypothetical protein